MLKPGDGSKTLACKSVVERRHIDSVYRILVGQQYVKIKHDSEAFENITLSLNWK